MTLNEKIIAAEKTLTDAYKNSNGKLFISFSGGKDSVVLRHIALKLFRNLPVVFSNTTNELIEITKYIKTFPNIITVKPKLSFTEVVEKYGFPLVSKEVSQKVYDLKNTNGVKTRTTRFQGDHKGNGKLSNKWRFLAEEEFNVTHKCCSILKKDPLEKWGKKQGLKPIIALMSDESRLRQQLALYGDDKNGKVYPFLRTGWTEEDIWAYAKLHDIRFAECYYDRIVNGQLLKARTRTGCEYCAFGVTLEKEDRFARSKISSPKRFEKMMNITNNGVKFSEVLSLIKQDTLPKPTLDIYGYTFSTEINKPQRLVYSLKPRHNSPRCSHCSSKKTNKKLSYRESFFDTPKDNVVRNIWVDITIHECEECGYEMTTGTPMINQHLHCTNRLIDYVEKHINTHSMAYIMEKCLINKDTLVKIGKYIISGRDDTLLGEYESPLVMNGVNRHLGKFRTPTEMVG